jgi:penicillin-binding protein 1C
LAARSLPGRERIATTLDRGAQLLAERAMSRAAHEMDLLGIHNGAVVIADHESGEVRALVGNFDFWDGVHGGQIAGFDVARVAGVCLEAADLRARHRPRAGAA